MIDEARHLGLKHKREAITFLSSAAKLLDKQGTLWPKELDKQGTSSGKGELGEVTAENRSSFQIADNNIKKVQYLRTQSRLSQLQILANN